MNKGFKLLFIVLLLLAGCGKAKSPTGGPEDKTPLKITTISPDNYQSLTEREIEIIFNKEVNKRSTLSAFRFYPPLDDYKIKVNDNKINITINDELIPNRNYYFTISKILKDTRNNALENNLTYIYSNGKLHDSKLHGLVVYAQEEDRALEKKLILLDKDSVTVFVKDFDGHFYDLDGLEHTGYILRSYIDKNKNGRYDVEKEPYFEKYIDSLKTKKVDLVLTYVDTSKVVIKQTSAPYNNLVSVTLSEPAVKWDSLAILNKADTTAFAYELAILDDDKITVVTAQQDTVDYEISFYNLTDKSGNITTTTRRSFSGSTKQDSLNLMIVASYPKNGSTVLGLLPQLTIGFNKVVLENDIVATLIENETKRNIKLNIVGSNSFKALLTPQNKLLNFNSYTFTLSPKTKDINGNQLKEEFQINFMITAQEETF